MGIETAILVASIASAGVGAYSAYGASKAAKQQAQFQSAVAQRNAEYAREDSKRIGQEGRQEVGDLQRRIAQAIGTGRATAASRGVLADDAEGDSSTNYLDDIAAEGQYDIAKSRDATALAQRNSLIRAGGFESSASAYNQKAKSYNPLLDAGSTLLSGTANTLDSKAARSLFA